MYLTGTFINSGLYILSPIFKGQKKIFNEVFSENSASMYGWCSIAVCNQEQVMMVLVYGMFCSKIFSFDCHLNFQKIVPCKNEVTLLPNEGFVRLN